MSEKIRIILVDDHVLVRDGIRALLEEQEEVEVINEASDGIEALKMIGKDIPDLVIADIRMPHMNGIDLVRQLKKDYPELKTLILSMHDSEEYVIQSMEAGADGYLLKGSSRVQFLKAVDTVLSGGRYFSGDISNIVFNYFSGTKQNSSTLPGSEIDLTSRERQVLTLVLQGKSNKEIAQVLDISVRTAEVHRFNMMKKMDVNNLIELANKARTHKLID